MREDEVLKREKIERISSLIFSEILLPFHSVNARALSLSLLCLVLPVSSPIDDVRRERERVLLLDFDLCVVQRCKDYGVCRD